jgi:hypothetical protein
LQLVVGSGLGVLRESEAERASVSFAELPPEARALARAPTPVLVVTKANRRSTVHRPGYTDYIGVKRYDGKGRVIGEHRFLGLFTSTAYSASVADTPLLRGKVEAIAERAGLPPGGHLAKALAHILETYPRDELFQIGDDELYEQALGILALGERPAAAPLREGRPVRTLRLVPGVRAARCLFDRPAHPLPAHPHGRLRQQQRRVQRAARRDGAGAHPFHDPHGAGPDARDRPQAARGQD